MTNPDSEMSQPTDGPKKHRYLDFKGLFRGPCLALVTVTACLLVAINFGAGIVAGAINVPGASGLITGFTVPFFLVMLNLTTKKFGTITLSWTIYSTITISMHLMGPPNVFKPLFGFAIGLAFEIPILLFGRRWFSFYVGLLGYVAAILGMAYVAFALLNLPGAANAYKFMYIIAVIFTVEGFLSVWMASRVYVRHVEGSQLARFFSGMDGN